MDGDAVSPTLVESCVNTWSDKKAKLLAASLLDISNVLMRSMDDEVVEGQPKDDADEQREIESKLVHGVAGTPEILQTSSSSALPQKTPLKNQLDHGLPEIPDILEANSTSALPSKILPQEQAIY